MDPRDPSRSSSFSIDRPLAPVPVIQAPTAPVPVIQAPTAPVPVIQAPTAPVPVIQAPTAPVPVIQAPTAPVSVIQAPAAPVPVIQAPTAPVPVIQAPTAPVPVIQAPTAPVSVIQAPAAHNLQAVAPKPGTSGEMGHAPLTDNPAGDVHGSDVELEDLIQQREDVAAQMKQVIAEKEAEKKAAEKVIEQAFKPRMSAITRKLKKLNGQISAVLEKKKQEALAVHGGPPKKMIKKGIKFGIKTIIGKTIAKK